jgi:hypothetical protein
LVGNHSTWGSQRQGANAIQLAAINIFVLSLQTASCPRRVQLLRPSSKHIVATLRMERPTASRTLFAAQTSEAVYCSLTANAARFYRRCGRRQGGLSSPEEKAAIQNSRHRPVNQQQLLLYNQEKRLERTLDANTGPSRSSPSKSKEAQPFEHHLHSLPIFSIAMEKTDQLISHQWRKAPLMTEQV